MIPFLMAAVLPAASSRNHSPGAAQACPHRYTENHRSHRHRDSQAGRNPQQVMAVMPEEIKATVKLYLDGKIRQWYSRGDGKGVVFVVDAKTEDEARAIMETLPLAKEHLMDHQYIPVGPLMPLRALNPGAFQ